MLFKNDYIVVTVFLPLEPQASIRAPLLLEPHPEHPCLLLEPPSIRAPPRAPLSFTSLLRLSWKKYGMLVPEILSNAWWLPSCE